MLLFENIAMTSFCEDGINVHQTINAFESGCLQFGLTLWMAREHSLCRTVKHKTKRSKKRKKKKLVLLLQQSHLCFLQVGRNTTTCKHWHHQCEIFPGVSWITGARRQGDVYIQDGACDIDLPSQDMYNHKIYPGSKYKSVNRKIWKHLIKAQGCLYAGSESQRHITTVTKIQRLGPYPAKSINRTLKLLPT